MQFQEFFGHSYVGLRFTSASEVATDPVILRIPGFNLADPR